jgi:hypothetical protein
VRAVPGRALVVVLIAFNVSVSRHVLASNLFADFRDASSASF